MSNVEAFRDHINELEVFMEEVKLENGDTGFRMQETIKGGGNVLFGIIFNADETIVDINVWGLADITNPMKKEDLLYLLNTLNQDYRFARFIENEGQVSVNYYSYIIDDGYFNPGKVIQHYVLLLNCLENVYPKFMRLQWA
ncbi:hypothetical protein [Exiguobacterium sp. s36]|uniref:hypothetical protein n=1 Tax=Exiguobacterium sp. s36 TaxID=2751227 RepID=UPI001BEB1482|nr:hypothetical protein [Exiguobacterium sp. s36]